MSSSDNEQQCNNGKFVLFYDNFGSGFTPDMVGSPYTYFSVPAAGLIEANDAAGGVFAGCGEVVINSTPFTYTNPTGLDHVKFLVFQKNAYNAFKEGEIVYEGVMSLQQTGLTGLPQILQSPSGIQGVSNANSDIRLAAGAFNCLDVETMMVFDFILSNEDIYAFYERLPFNRTEWGGLGPNYTAFSHAIPVGKRNIADPTNDFVKLAIGYNYHENTVRWLINDVEVFRVNRLGYPIERKYRLLEHNIPGTPQALVEIIRPKQLQYGFGTFSLMDMYNPQNPGQIDNAALVDLSVGVLPYANPIVTDVFGTPIAPTFLSPYPLAGASGTNFGQGAILKLKYVTVYLLAPIEHIRTFPSLKHCKETIIQTVCQQNAINGVNASDDLVSLKCKGFISNCDNCDPPEDPCGCLFPEHNCCSKKRKPKKPHKCPCYKPHSFPCK